MAITRRTLLGAGVSTLAYAMNLRHAGAAADFDDPARAVLTVTRNGERLGAFSRNDLVALPQTRISTCTPWAAAVMEYEGPPVAQFLSRFAVRAGQLRLLALNDYLVTADAEMLIDGGAILAIKENGAFMPASSKGPVFVMFPFDSDPRLQSQQYYARAVWQLIEIDVS
tara:strand:- start:183 stop:689 length:507 start_codon:yes stop_codon:yes gene_type:complete